MKNKNFKLPEPNEGNAFKVPEGYFADLQQQILSKTVLSTSPKLIKFNFKPLYAAAASLAALCAIAGSVVLINPDLLDKVFPVKDTDSLKVIEITSKNEPIPALVTDVQTAENNSFTQNEVVTEDPTDSRIQNDNSVTAGRRKNAGDAYEKQNNTLQSPTPPNLTSNTNFVSKPVLPNVNQAGQDNSKLRKPKAFSLGDDVCSESPIQINGPEGNGLFYRWSNGDITQSTLIEKSSDVILMIAYDKSFTIFTSDTIHVAIKPVPEINIPSTQSVCSNESLIIYAIENQDKSRLFSYEWSHSKTKSSFLKLDHLKPGTYNMSVKIKGCKTYGARFQIQVNDCQLNIPNIFTPNSDGYNDFFVIDGLESYPGSQLSIFDRYGKVIYQSLNYQNNWDATNAESATYFYILKVNDSHKTERKGSITVYR